MSDVHFTPLKNRALIRITGADATTFLQGLITNDIEKVNEKTSIYALMLTPQGKFLYEFFISDYNNEGYVLDTDAAHLEACMKRLKMYTLRSDVTIEDISNEYEVVAILGEMSLDPCGVTNTTGSSSTFCQGLFYVDPRNEKLFVRANIKIDNNYEALIEKGATLGTIAQYEQLRISLNIADGAQDLTSGEHYPLQYRMEEVGAIDYKKGCYVGQEVTARTHYKGTIKKSLFVIESEDPLPPIGTEITESGKKAGIMKSSNGNIGLAHLDVTTAEKGATLEANGKALSIR